MLKNSFNTTKNLRSFASYWLCLLSYCSFSQSAEKQIIQVEKMEYAYEPSILESIEGLDYLSNSRVILPNDPEIADKMKQSILTAINNRWNAAIFNPQWNLKEISYYGKSPKFKPNLKKGTPGSWHLFLQVIDSGPYTIAPKNSWFFSQSHTFQSQDNVSCNLQFNVQIIDGNNGSIIFSNKMMVAMQRTPVPDGQILLQKLPTLPNSFLQAFDTAVQTLFAVSTQSELKLEIPPACLLWNTDSTLAKAKKLNFVTKNDSIIELLQLKQEWIIQNSITQKTKKENNFGNNLFHSTLTILTGIGTENKKGIRYATKFSFIDTKENVHYFCEIPFMEETTEENEREVSEDAYGSKSYSILNASTRVSRTFNPDQMCYLIREKDTIGHFKLIMGERAISENNILQYWDGKNKSTISTMPEFWNNSKSAIINPFFLDGELNKVHFIIEKGKAGNQTGIEINGQKIMALETYNDNPISGLLFANPPDEKALSVLIMLSTMPFSSIF